MKTNALRFLYLLFLLTLPFTIWPQDAATYLSVLNKEGKEPIPFIHQKLKDHDLILFDDALHSALEPFEFYQELLKAKDNPVRYVFLEVFGIQVQPYLDAYFEDKKKDNTHLVKVFQDDFSGYGWRYKTYYDLLSTIWDLNQHLSADQRIKGIGVDQPVYWQGIHSREEYTIFQKSLTGRDYFMYKIIKETMEGFNKGKKGIFLTNTRHAYKHIRNKDDQLYWNCGTFFKQWHPAKTYAVRIHNVTLSIEAQQETAQKNTSMQGLEKYVYQWIRMEDGRWDEAFKQYGNRPVAFSLKNNVFGKATYVGNHMRNVKKGQSMYDAYDALLFLAPLEELHFSAKLDFFYTSTFKKELKRRIEILEECQVGDFLKKNEVESLDEFIEQLSQYVGKSKNTLVE